MSTHHFGEPTELMGIGERLCNEKNFGKREATTIFHIKFTLLEGGDMACDLCGEKFLARAQKEF